MTFCEFQSPWQKCSMRVRIARQHKLGHTSAGKAGDFCVKALLPTTISFALLATSSYAETPAATYICVENRSVGWETRESGEEVYGKFKPAEERFFVRYYKSTVGQHSDFITLAYIEVVENGVVSTHNTADCNIFFVSFFLQQTSEFNTKRRGVEYCDALGKNNRFGNNGVEYNFFGKLDLLPMTIAYTYSQNILPDRAYLSKGQCVKSD
jgi:hypothetical protein